ncbi:SPOR domain-containing protein [Novosphingobium sp. 2638]|uniref:SPOR domain-containing protein n=1 Tax=Novosphingobium beihaiensis TaxID=2930389 RepID=A0ABT0BKF0_9SPHN|nr:SPOR domain-containing protein [Novosphingobium beihaiensis]
MRLLAGAAVGASAIWSAGAFAQGAPVVSQPVVQALPNPNTERLSDALTKLGRDPRDTDALVEAGDAARSLGDLEAAIGFYRRANEIVPNDARVKAGLARTYVLSGDPVTAIPYFTEAEKAGAVPSQIADDRGLAYDLVGDNASAQRYYAMAMLANPSEEVRMRLAISQAIAGDQKGAETTLMPLLRKQDKPGWRARAFALAIAGETKQAVDITETILPPKLAESVAPYMRYMPRLTRAQQAAAANLGRFPRASEIGQDDPRIAAYSPPRVASADAALVPKGDALDRGGKNAKAVKADAKKNRRKPSRAAVAAADPDRTPPPEPKPAIESTGELPPLAASRPMATATATAPERKPSPPAPGAVPVRNPKPRETTPAKAPAPGFNLASLPSAGASAAPSSSAPKQAPAAKPAPRTAEPAPAPSLSAAFADLGKPALRAAPASGAVDIRQIDPARPKPKAKPKPQKPAPPAHPSRIWVQIGVGRDKKAIAFDWRRYTRREPALFKGRKAYVTEMGRTNRILAGPFETRKAANEFIADLKKAGFNDALPWTSPAGQVVDVLPVN